MEQPFYHDDSFLSGYGRAELSGLLDYKALKQSMALNGGGGGSEPYRGLKAPLQLRGPAGEDGSPFFAPTGLPEAGSNSSLKLASPELERLIIQNSNGVITTTPTPGPYFYSRGATEEQEGFADGFVKALDDLHKLNHMPPPNVSIGAAASAASSAYGATLHQEPPPVYTNLTSYNPSTMTTSSSYPTANLSYLPQTHAYGGHTLATSLSPRVQVFKEEPQTVPDVQSPPVSPINMEDQERIKVERKRLRNRLAATKCRKRKLERIARLEDKVKTLKTENAGLSNTASVLRDQVAQLKQKVMNHVNNGCQLLLTVKMQSF
ncbi:transcription factor JunB [Carettochelys insculpta]|uniref:transcription factor JunB n=1 Tax=Carettochelys insculpta TaxID=44489 RepID=UPI003EBB4F63